MCAKYRNESMNVDGQDLSSPSRRHPAATPDRRPAAERSLETFDEKLLGRLQRLVQRRTAKPIISANRSQKLP